MAILTTADVRSTEFQTVRKGGIDPDDIDSFVDDVCESLAASADQVKSAESERDEALAEATEMADTITHLQARLDQAQARVERAESELAAEKAANEEALSQAAAALAIAQENTNAMQAKVDEMNKNSGVSESVELLASAHKTAEETIARAEAHATSVREEADLYSSNTRGEADNYAHNMREAAAAELDDLKRQADALRAGQADYRSQILNVLRSATEFIEGSLAVDSEAGEPVEGEQDVFEGEHSN